MEQQTAVDYFKDELIKKGFFVPKGIYTKAKSMEKEQIQKAFSNGQETPINHPTIPHYSREEYYNEKYGK